MGTVQQWEGVAMSTDGSKVVAVARSQIVYAAAVPSPPAASSGITGDPHLKGAHGEEADFKGDHRATYNVLSARNLSLNVLIEHDIFRTQHSKLHIHGSWIRAVFVTARSSRC